MPRGGGKAENPWLEGSSIRSWNVGLPLQSQQQEDWWSRGTPAPTIEGYVVLHEETWGLYQLQITDQSGSVAGESALRGMVLARGRRSAARART